MEPFKTLKSIVVPLDRANVDTDAIIPKQFLKSIKRSGFGPNLFDEWRYLDVGEPDQESSGRPLNKDFVLNQKRYQGGQILLARENFGCGSSREHAPWALFDYGFRVVIAPSFADIFFNNCFKNGILPVVLDAETVAKIFAEIESEEGYELEVNLAEQIVSTPAGLSYLFEVDEFRKYCLLNGLDDIALTLQHESDIDLYEARRRKDAPWLFAS